MVWNRTCRGQVKITCGYDDPLAASGPVYSRSAVWKTHWWARWGINWCKDVVTEFVTEFVTDSRS